MKHFIFVFITLLFLGTSSRAQEPLEKKNFAYAGIGTMSLPEAAYKFIDVWITALSAGYTTSDTRSTLPALTAGYHIYSSERFSFGASITFEVLRTDIMYGSRFAGTNEASFISPMAEGRFEYVSSETFGMYLEYGLGVCFLSKTAKYDQKNDSASKTILSAQFTPVGLRFGDKFRANLGIGLGMKGLFMASMGMRF